MRPDYFPFSGIVFSTAALCGPMEYSAFFPPFVHGILRDSIRKLLSERRSSYSFFGNTLLKRVLFLQDCSFLLNQKLQFLKMAASLNCAYDYV